MLDRTLQALFERDRRLEAERVRASAMSAQELRRSPGRGGKKCRSTGFPSSPPIVSASSSTLVGRPAETLKIRPLAPTASAASRFAATTFST